MRSTRSSRGRTAANCPPAPGPFSAQMAPPPQQAWQAPADKADPRLSRLTLGHKKAMARTHRDPDLLARLAAEAARGGARTCVPYRNTLYALYGSQDELTEVCSSGPEVLQGSADEFYIVRFEDTLVEAAHLPFYARLGYGAAATAPWDGDAHGLPTPVRVTWALRKEAALSSSAPSSG